jgi:hypothetical protein
MRLTMAKNGLAVALIDDYVDLGFGERVSDTEIRSLDGESTLALETSDTHELNIFINGDFVETVSYDDEDFTKKLLIHVGSALNV